MAEVELEGVTKLFPSGVRAVDDLSLVIADQEFLVIVGSSGCGKTTTLRLLAGLEDATAGIIRIGGTVVNKVAPKDRDVAMVFQNHALYPHMSVYRNMAFGLLLRSETGWCRQAIRLVFNRPAYRAARQAGDEIRRRVEQAAELLEIRHLLDRRPGALSGGQRQRVAVGRAIVRRPKVFLFDEPLSNLDARLRVEMRGELRRLHRKLGTTTVYVTHDQEEAMMLGDRLAVLRAGRVHQCARPLEVYRRPADRFVAGFIGSPPMNFVSGRLVAAESALWFEGESIRLRLPRKRATCLQAMAGKNVTLGFRPDAVSVRRNEEVRPDDRCFIATVAVVEPLGEKLDVCLETGQGTRLMCRMDADSQIREGQQWLARVNANRAHVFAPGENGENLTVDADGDADGE